MRSLRGPEEEESDPRALRASEPESFSGRAGSDLVLSVQRTAGNRAATRLIQRTAPPVMVQRYTPLEDDEVTLPDEETQHDTEMFTSHTVDPTVNDLAMGPEWEHVTTSNPDSKGSADRTIVMQDTTNEPQEFYASGPVAMEAQQKLEQHQSYIGLVPNGATLDVGGRNLTGLTAASKIVNPYTDDGVRAEKLTTHICIDMANSVMGLPQTHRNHAVKTQGDDEDQATSSNIATDSVKSTQINDLAERLTTAGGEDTHGDILGSEAKAQDSTGRRYGTASGSGQTSEAERKLGVNSFANPEVGEGFATYSIQTNEEDMTNKRDYSAIVEEHPTLREFMWGYHYAGVVAKSEDGLDHVTLENYNRKGDIAEAFFDKIKDVYGEQAVAAVEGSKTDIASVQDLYMTLVQGMDPLAIKEGFAQAHKRANSEALKAWFFAMYGSGEGQSFHEKSAASGYFANPLTVRVGARDGQTYDKKSGYVKGYASVLGRLPGYHPDVEQEYWGGQYYQRVLLPAVTAVEQAHDEQDAERVYRQRLTHARGAYMRNHYYFARRAAAALEVREDEDGLPGFQVPAEGQMLAQLQQIAAGCLTKADRYSKLRSRPQRELRAANQQVLSIKEKVGQAIDYYSSLA